MPILATPPRSAAHACRTHDLERALLALVVEALGHGGHASPIGTGGLPGARPLPWLFGVAMRMTCAMEAEQRARALDTLPMEAARLLAEVVEGVLSYAQAAVRFARWRHDAGDALPQ